MKNKFIIFSTILLLFFSFSCSQSPIFTAIEQEEELETAKIVGNIYKMVPLNGKLYVQNGHIYTKNYNATKSEWTEITFPSTSESDMVTSAVRIASDSEYLYALTVDLTEYTSDSTYRVYACIPDSGTITWTLIGAAKDHNALFDNQVFDVTTGTTIGRNAYIRTSTGTYKLNGTNSLDLLTSVGDTVDYKCSVNINGKDNFFTTTSAIAVGNYAYSIEEYVIVFYTYNTTTNTLDKIDTKTYDQYLCSITYNPDTGNLLIGTKNSIYNAVLSNGSLPNSLIEITNNNASSSFGTREVYGIWCYGSENTIYASTIYAATTMYNKLWAFYKTIGYWNYE